MNSDEGIRQETGSTYGMTDEILHPIEEGQHYKHRRGSFYTIDHLNDDIILLYDGRNYRLENKQYFRESVQEKMFELQPELEITQSEVAIPFDEIDWVGDEAIKSLNGAGMVTPKDFDYRTDEWILNLDSVGKKTLQNICEWIENNTTDTVEL